MSIILKYILKNIREKKLRSFLIIISLTLSVIVLTFCLTLKDNILSKYTEFLMKTSGTSDISVEKKVPFEKSTIDNLPSNYNSVPYMIYSNEKDNVIGSNVQDLKKNKMIKSSLKEELKNNEVIISKKTASNKKLKVGDIVEVCDTDLKIVEIVEPYGVFIGEDEEQFIYLTSIECANELMFKNLDEELILQLDKSKTYIIGAYIDLLDDNIEEAKEELEKIDKEFKVITIKASFEEAINQMNSLMIIMLVITTLIAFYIISSILKLVLEERLSVIGTFRSIGASRGKTNFLLYLENSVYAIISSAIGIAIANLLLSNVTDAFISSGDLQLKGSAGIRPIYILIVVAFTILVQVVITYFELRKSKNKSIKDIIFETQDTKYKIKKGKIIFGSLLIILSIIIYFLNYRFNFIMGLLPVIFVIVGFVLVIPIIIKLISKLLSMILKNTSTAYLACKNVADNKILLSSTTLLFIIVAMTTIIYNISVTITNTYEGFDKATHYTMRIHNVSGKEEDYAYIRDVEGVKEMAFYYLNMGYYKIDNKEKIFAIVGYDKDDDTVFKLYDSINFNKNEADNLKEDEMLLDEAFAIKNNYKIGSKIKIDNELYFKKERTFTIKGYIDSTNTASMRTVSMISKDTYNELFEDTSKTILIDSDLSDEKMKENLEKAINDKNIEVISYSDWIGSDKESTKEIMNIVYAVLALAVGLSMIGLINNGLVAFVQRKKSYAVLNSVCMTKNQLYKMVIEENIFSFIIAIIPGIILSFILRTYIQKTLKGMNMFLNMVCEMKGVAILLIIIFVLVIIESIVPIRKIKKIDLVKEIKYE